MKTGLRTVAPVPAAPCRRENDRGSRGRYARGRDCARPARRGWARGIARGFAGGLSAPSMMKTAGGRHGRFWVTAGSRPVFQRSGSVRQIERPDGFAPAPCRPNLAHRRRFALRGWRSQAKIARPTRGALSANAWRTPVFHDGIVLREEQEMMRTGFEAVDADGHVHAEEALFTEYLDPAYHERTQV